jgi:hypothetical protein
VCPSRAKEAADSGIFDLYSDRFSAGPSPPYVALPPCTVMMRMEGRRWGCLVRRHHHMETGFRQQQAAEERRGERERRTGYVLVRVDRKQIPVFFTFPFIYSIYCPTTTARRQGFLQQKTKMCFFLFFNFLYNTEKGRCPFIADRGFYLQPADHPRLD